MIDNMSQNCKVKCFALIPESSITTAMLNRSGALKLDNLPRKVVLGIISDTYYRIFPLFHPVPAVFDNFTWYTAEDLAAKLVELNAEDDDYLYGPR